MSEVTLLIGGPVTQRGLSALLDRIDEFGFEKLLPWNNLLQESLEMTEASFVRHFKPGPKQAKNAAGVEFTTNIGPCALAFSFTSDHDDIHEWDDCVRMLGACQLLCLTAKLIWIDLDENGLETGGRVMLTTPSCVTRDYKLDQDKAPMISISGRRTFDDAIDLLQEAERARDAVETAVPPLEIRF